MWAMPAMAGNVGAGYQMPMTSASGTMQGPEVTQGFPRAAMSTPSPVSATPSGPFTGLTTLATIPGVTPASLLAAVAMRRGQPQGPANDQEMEDFLYDTLEMLPGTSEIDVRCEGGRVTMTGSVHHKRVKRDVGELAWAVPVVNDVQNNVTIASRRRARASAGREGEAQATSARKQS
jgi:hypothetical protein